MLTRTPRYFDTLRPALQAAVAAHRPWALRNLRAAHGSPVFAKALAGLSGRAIADVLSMLHASDRASVLLHLPRDAKLRLGQAGGVDAAAANVSDASARFAPVTRSLSGSQA